eukprot:GHRQ01001090.1.p1 GENE.GHRQ01001090.1~~GHRQ01001090.1.p1  ORF type:complete len:157 (+),score=55.13 GHRQ01001090.1:165-635(+)
MAVHLSAAVNRVAGHASIIRQRRRLVVANAAEQLPSQNAPLFQLDNRHNLTMADVRDAYEVCSLIPDPNERHQCYSVFGVDAQRMARYYDTVSRLEEQLGSDLTSSTVAALARLQQQHPGTPSDSHAITGSPPPPAAAAAVAVAMLWIAAQHLAFL